MIMVIRKKIMRILMAGCLMISVFYAPIEVHAEVQSTEYPLDGISIAELELSGVYGKIKNAAVIHLIVQKMYMCFGSLPKEGESSLRANWSGGTDDVENEGDIFVSKTTDVGVGPWLGGVLDGNSGRDGDIKCAHTTKTTMLDLLAYLFKNVSRSLSPHENFSKPLSSIFKIDSKII